MTGILATGTLNTTAASTLVTITAGTIGYVTMIKLTNVDSAARTFNIFLKVGAGSASHFGGKDVSLAAGASVSLIADPRECVMAGGDEIQGDCDADDMIEFVVSRFEV